MDEDSDYERIPEDQQIFPEDGIVQTPDFPDTLFEVRNVHGGEKGFIRCHFLVAEGSMLIAGKPFAEFESDKALIEYAAPCDAIVEKLLLANGAAVGSNEPMVKIRRK